MMEPGGSFSAFQTQMGRMVSGQKDVRGPRQGTKGRRDEPRETVKGERSESGQGRRNESKDSMEAAPCPSQGLYPGLGCPELRGYSQMSPLHS